MEAARTAGPAPAASPPGWLSRVSAGWHLLALLLVAKQLLAASWAWDLPLGKRVLLRQAVLALLSSEVLVALLRLARPRRALAIFVAIDALVSLLLVGDVLHVRQFGTPTSVYMLRYAGGLSTVDGAVWALVRPHFLLLFADLPVLAAACLWLGAPAGRAPRPGRLALLAAGAAAGTAAAALAIPPNYFGNSGVAWSYGLLDFHAYDLVRTGLDRLRRQRPDRARSANLVAGMRSGRPGAPAGSLHAMAQGGNLIVVQVESLQAWVPGLRLAGVPITPYIDALSAESLVAGSFFHQTGPGRSSDADLLTNCSVHARSDVAAAYAYDDNAFHCLPALLAEAGYETVAFQGAPGDLWNTRHMYRRYGFGTFLSLENLKVDEVLGVGLSDESLLRQARERIERLREPFYAFVVTVTSHGPFAHGRPLPPARLPSEEVRRYLAALRYTDEQLGAFVAGLRASGLLDRSVLVLYGDHDGVPWSRELGASLGMRDDEVSRFLLLRKVPLLVRLPRGAAAGALDEPLGQIDLAPTLVGALGVDGSAALFQGREAGGARPAAVVFPGGEAVDATRLYLPGPGPGAGARCWSLAARSAMPPDRCADLAGRANDELATSRLLLELDLHAGARAAAAEAPAAPAAP